MQDTVSEIKSRIDILTLVRQYVSQLKQAGKNWKALCPFHSEKTPSFVISPDKGIAYCFGCHKGGDIFKFIQDYENVSFKEALQILAEKAGLELKPISKQEVLEIKDTKQKMFAVHSDALDFFEKQLWETKNGEEVRKYLEKRGVHEDSAQEFHLGFAPDSYDEMVSFLSKKGFSVKDLLDAGLAASRPDASYYDRFRQRLMFPIQDMEGRVIAFGGRALSKDVDAKYINSPETIIYHKGRTIFNLGRSKNYIREQDSVIVMEGYMDVIMSHQAGIKNIVASSGTAFTEDQMKTISRLTNNICFAFDSDTAGIEASRRAISIAQDYEMNIKVIVIPQGKDPADAVKENPEIWVEATKNALPYMDFYFDKLIKSFDAKTPDGIKQILEAVVPVFLKVKNRIELDHYVLKLTDRLGVKAVSIYEELKRKKEFVHFKQSPGIVPQSAALKFTPEDYLFGLLLNSESAFKYFEANYKEQDLPDFIKLLYRNLKDYYNAPGAEEVSEYIFARLPEDSREKAQIVSLWVETKTALFSSQLIEKEVEKTIFIIKRNKYSKSQHELLGELKEARRIKDKEKEKLLFNQYNQLLSLYGQKSS